MRHDSKIENTNMKQKNQTQMRAVVTVVDDGGDAHRAPQGVILAVRGQFLKTFKTQKKHCSETDFKCSICSYQCDH